MNQTQTLDPILTAALRRELVALPSAKRRHTRRVAVIAAGAFGALALGGVTAVAGLRPAGEVANPPLAPPVILNGVGSAKVVLPDAPGNEAPPDLVPAVATNGKSGWVDYHLFTDQAHPQLTPEGTSQAPIPVYGADGTTLIGEADVSQPYQR